MSDLRRNPPLVASFHALQMSLFPVSVLTLFWAHRIGMSMTEIFLVQGFFGLSVALLEFPSGYLADRLGYRRTLLSSAALGAAGWTLYTFAHDFSSVIVAESVLGASISLASGCDDALLYESLKATEREHSFGAWTGRVRFFGQTGEGSAALVAGALYAWSPSAPFALQAVVSIVNVAVAFAMVEPPRKRPPSEQHWAQIRAMMRLAFVQDRRLTAVIFTTIALGLSSFVPVWLIALYATNAGVPEHWIGPIWALANYSVAWASLGSTRLVRSLGLSTTLLGCAALIALGYGGLSLHHGLYGFAFYFCLTTMRGLFGPALLSIENRLIPSSDRAGMMSLRSLAFRLTFLALGPLVGAAVDAAGQPPVLAGLGVAFTLAALMGCFLLRRALVEIHHPSL